MDAKLINITVKRERRDIPVATGTFREVAMVLQLRRTLSAV
jgi:hypothetical protein